MPISSSKVYLSQLRRYLPVGRERFHRTAFSADEEGTACEILFQYDNCGVPLTRTHLSDETEIPVRNIPSERHSRLSFKYSRPWGSVSEEI